MLPAKSYIVKAAKLVRTIHKVCEVFKKETSDASTSDKYPYPVFTKDFNEVLGVLEEMEVFNPLEKRQHSCFSWKGGLLQSLSKYKLVKLIKKNVDQLT